MQYRFIDSIKHVDKNAWNALWPSTYPFTKFEFLHALEISGSTTEKSGWQPSHLIAYEGESLVFAMPMYLKTHSYGEYVFDWSWADAYARNGLDYYPKLLSAIPFTPATGPRWAVADKTLLNFQEVNAYIVEHAKAMKASSFHCLFPDAESKQLFVGTDLIERNGCQFHWFNRNYRDFDDYLSHFSSRKRKNIRKERQKTAEFNIEIASAAERETKDWEWFYQLYHRTYLKRSGRPGYLGADFFLELANTLADQLLLASASYNGENIAGAVYFKDDDCLYGRYWGSSLEVDALHFETCYYRGIDYAIEHQLQRFDPGAQGEHKIQRGFQAVKTCSYHWVENAAFRTAIDRFCAQEREHNEHYLRDARSYLPFKEGFIPVDEAILLNAAQTK